jgi:hypothetical protein
MMVDLITIFVWMILPILSLSESLISFGLISQTFPLSGQSQKPFSIYRTGAHQVDVPSITTVTDVGSIRRTGEAAPDEPATSFSSVSLYSPAACLRYARILPVASVLCRRFLLKRLDGRVMPP